MKPGRPKTALLSGLVLSLRVDNHTRQGLSLTQAVERVAEQEGVTPRWVWMSIKALAPYRVDTPSLADGAMDDDEAELHEVEDDETAWEATF